MNSHHPIWRNLLAVAILAVLSGCAIATDLSGTSIAPALSARPAARTHVVPGGKLADVYRKAMAIGDAAGWEVFQEFPEERLVVYHLIPGAVDSTQVGVFCSETDQGILVEVSSLSAFTRDSVAKTLFGRL